MDLTTRQMHAAWGNPCEKSYETFSLESGQAV
jgi:hypothetical protein